jgi:hypothetical protein
MYVVNYSDSVVVYDTKILTNKDHYVSY